MKKQRLLKTLLVAASLFTGVSAWAGDITTLYERGAGTAWSEADITAWACNAGTVTIDGGLKNAFGNTGWSGTQTITPTTNAIVTLSATLQGANTGRASAYDYIKIGGVSLRLDGQSQIASLDIDGTTTQLATGITRGGTYSIVITINTGSGVVSYSYNGGATTEASAANSTAVTNVEIGYHKNGSLTGGTYILKTIEVTNETQAVTNADYTINYKFGGETIKTVGGTSIVGATVNAESPITISDQKYYATDDATTSMVLAAEGNVLDVTLRKALSSTVNIKAVDGESNVLKTFSAERVEGDDASNLYYTRVVKYNDKYYKVAAANGNGVNYGRSMAYGAADVEVTYTLDDNISYYAEDDELNNTANYAGGGNVPERASGGSWQRLVANGKVWTDALPAGIYTIDVSGRNQGGSEGALAVQVRLSNGTLIDTGKKITLGSSVCAVQNFTGIEVPEGASIAIAETGGYNSNIGLDYIIAYKTADGPSTASVTVSDAGMATYVNSLYDLNFSTTAIKAYKAKVTAKGVCTLTEVTNVPAGTPVLLIKDGGATENIPVMTGAAAVSDNDLVAGTDAAVATNETIEEVDYTNMILNNVSGIGFYLANGQTVAANRAYLHFNSSLAPAGSRMTLLFGDDTTTGINSVENAKTIDGVYNLNGQRVAQPTRGLYIVNGKKVVVK